MAETWVDELVGAGEELPDELRQRILALGGAAEAPLRDLIADDRLFDEGAAGDGWAPIHALRLLGELRATSAIPRMIELVRSCDWDEWAFSAADIALSQMGSAALEPLLAAYADEERDEWRTTLAAILAQLGVRDERIWQVLVECFDSDHLLGASSFAQYGDPRALPKISAALDDAEGLEIVDLAGALEELGGTLSAAQQKRRDVEVARRRRMVPRHTPRMTSPRPGRNDSCHCGSGKKYKKCHLEADERDGDAEPAVAPKSERPFSRTAYDSVVRALMQSRRRDPREDGAVAWARPLLIGYTLFGMRDAAGRRFVDRFAADEGRKLARQERLALEALQRGWASLYEVASVERGVEVVLFDCVSGDAVEVREQSITYEVEAGDWLFAWLFPVGDWIELVGVSCSVPDYAREAALAAVRTTDGPDRGAAAGALHDVLVRAVAERPLPELRTSDGDELMFCKAHFTVRDEAALQSALEAAHDFHGDGPGHYVWASGERVLGQLTVAGGAATLDVMSRERLAEGKARVVALAGEAVQPALDSMQSVAAAMRDRPAARSERERKPNPERDDLAAELLRRHYGDWSDVPLPALDGQTPRQAAESAEGRMTVRALVDEMERRTWSQPGGDRVDFSPLRAELGLDDDLDLQYDASRAPAAADWLDADEGERIDAVAAFHRRLEVHPPMPNPRLHALVHVVVENQLAAGDPKEARAALARLRKAGLSRHEALHAIGEIVAVDLFAVMREGKFIDRQASERALSALRPGKHAGSAPL